MSIRSSCTLRAPSAATPGNCGRVHVGSQAQVPTPTDRHQRRIPLLHNVFGTSREQFQERVRCARQSRRLVAVHLSTPESPAAASVAPHYFLVTPRRGAASRDGARSNMWSRRKRPIAAADPEIRRNVTTCAEFRKHRESPTRSWMTPHRSTNLQFSDHIGRGSTTHSRSMTATTVYRATDRNGRLRGDDQEIDRPRIDAPGLNSAVQSVQSVRPTNPEEFALPLSSVSQWR